MIKPLGKRLRNIELHSDRAKKGTFVILGSSKYIIQNTLPIPKKPVNNQTIERITPIPFIHVRHPGTAVNRRYSENKEKENIDNDAKKLNPGASIDLLKINQENTETTNLTPGLIKPVDLSEGYSDST